VRADEKLTAFQELESRFGVAAIGLTGWRDFSQKAFRLLSRAEGIGLKTKIVQTTTNRADKREMLSGT
jgi:hypothetical protein